MARRMGRRPTVEMHLNRRSKNIHLIATRSLAPTTH